MFWIAAEIDVALVRTLVLMGVGICILVLTLRRMGRRRQIRGIDVPPAATARAAGGGASFSASTGPSAPPAHPGLAGGPNASHTAPQRDEAGTDRRAEEPMVQLHELAREIEGKLATRIRFAQRLIEDSERSARRLEALLGQAGALTEQRAPELFAPEARSPAVRAAPTEANEQPLNPAHADVARLMDQGLETREIAHALGRPIGEVQLVQSLLAAKKHART